MRDKGCSLFVYPGAFNLTTGPAHWELLQRARAVDNQGKDILYSFILTFKGSPLTVSPVRSLPLSICDDGFTS